MRKPELVYSLNAGAVDPDALSRVDLEKMRLAGEHPVLNLLPMVLGPATLRPGTQNILRIPSDDETRLIKFERSVGTGYILLLSAGEMRVVSDDGIVQVPAVSATINSGSWSNVSTLPAVATSGASPTLTATKYYAAKLTQSVSIAGGDVAKVHILRVDVTTGPVYLSVGTSSGASDLVSSARLDDGIHKISFTPGVSTVYVELRSIDPSTKVVGAIQFESTLIGGTGDLVFPTPWSTIAQIDKLRAWQSIDVMFIGDGDNQPRRLTHRGPQSWGVELFKPRNGPFSAGNPNISIQASATSGNVTLTASDNFFRSGHVGALIEISHTGKFAAGQLQGIDEATDYITVTGSDNSGRSFLRAGTSTSFVGTVNLERSFDAVDPVTWSTYKSFTNAAAGFAAINDADTFSNLTVHYRFRVAAYTSGSVFMTLFYETHRQVGVARITGYTSPTQVSAEIIEPVGLSTATRDWRIGTWSTVDGWPRTPVIHDSRMHWFRQDNDFASRVDDYTNFDDSLSGDAAPLTRSVGTGGADGVVWAVSDNRLLAGTASFEAAIAASELDEPLTPSAYTVRRIARRGCADILPAQHDGGLFYVQRSRRKLYEVSSGQGGRYQSNDVSRLNPAAYAGGVSKLAVQQQPDSRCYAVLSDGTITVLTYEPDDKVVAITTIEVAGGLVEDIAVLTDNDQDDVYLIVNRSGERYLERFAPEADQRAVSTCALLDGHKVLTGSISSITGGTHFAGETVQVWADGVRHADVTLDGSGTGALAGTYSRVVYGKSYEAVFKSVKLAHASQFGPSIAQTKIVKGVGMVLSTSCLDGVRIGRDESTVEPLPDVINGVVRTANQLFDHIDLDIMPINSSWDSDARIYLTVDSAEGPCTVQAFTIDIETRDGAKTGQ